MTDRAVIGDTPRRREDARFVTGHGAYLDDLRFDGVAHAVFVRSPHAHARITAIDTDDALRGPGVLAILIARDAAADGLRPLRPQRTKPTSRPTSRFASCHNRYWPTTSSATPVNPSP